MSPLQDGNRLNRRTACEKKEKFFWFMRIELIAVFLIPKNNWGKKLRQQQQKPRRRQKIKDAPAGSKPESVGVLSKLENCRPSEREET